MSGPNEKQLLGDKVEEMLRKAKVDKVAALYEKVTKRPCGCAKRKEQLNVAHRQFLQRNT